MRHNCQYCQGVHKNKPRLNEEKENTGIRFNEPATNLGIRHTITNNRKQQHCCCSNDTQRAAAAAAAALCMHINLTSRLLKRHLNHHTWYISLHWDKKKSENGAQKKKRRPRFEPRTPRSQGQQPICYPTLFFVYIGREWYVSTRTNRRSGCFDEK